MVAPTALDRRQVVSELVSGLNDTLIISGLGSPTYDLHASGDEDRYYYLWGAMGSAALMGFGLAMAQPARQILVITGDGEQLMGLGGLATIGVHSPANLSIVVIDNGHFGETGMQQSHTSLCTDLSAVAKSCGITHTRTVTTESDVSALRHQLFQEDGTQFAVVKVDAANKPRSIAPMDGKLMKNRIRAQFGY